MLIRRPVAFLVDTSVWTRMGQASVAEEVQMLSLRDLVWTCRAVDLELAYSERSRLVERSVLRRRLMKEAPITSEVMDQSLDLSVRMAGAGLHRHAKPIDLVIASAALASGLTVLHYDRDFDHIATVTGQPMEWVSPPGSLD